MADDDGRIRLAEAMGWRRGEVHTVAVMGRPITAQRWIDPDGNDRAINLPDPFTDANDDYAVLEWMTGKAGRVWLIFAGCLPHASSYQIGDYARAALKALDQ